MASITSFNVDDQLAVAGPIAVQFRDLSALFWDQPHIPPALIELCRIDLALLHRADAELAATNPRITGLDQAKVDAVLAERWRKDASLTEAEKSVLNFTEYYFVDPQSIPDEIAAGVIGHFGENGLVCLVEALGFIDSRIRVALLYSVLSA